MDPTSDTPTPLDVLWQAPVIIWVLVAGEGLAAVLALAPGITDNRLIYFGSASLVVQWVSLLTIGGLYLLRRSLARLRAVHVACIALGLLTAAAWLVSGATWLLLRSQESDDWRITGLRFGAIALTVGLLGLGAFYNHWRTRQFVIMAKQAELDALRARIQPHFLFNTLNTGAALVRQHPADAEQLLLDLADLFRAALVGPRFSLLEQELGLARRYLDIESLRFGERLRTEWQLPAVLPTAIAPTLSIQPLVENAIRHGIEPSAQGGLVSIVVAADGDFVRVSIRNSLPPHGTPPRNGHRIGQSAVRARLEAMPGKPGKLETQLGPDSYTTTITLPLAGSPAAPARPDEAHATTR